MIRVTIEMVPGGIGEGQHMATIEIANDLGKSLETDGRRGDYFAVFSRISQHGEHLGWYDRGGTVENVARYKSGAVYEILYGALHSFLGKKP